MQRVGVGEQVDPMRARQALEQPRRAAVQREMVAPQPAELAIVAFVVELLLEQRVELVPVDLAELDALPDVRLPEVLGDLEGMAADGAGDLLEHARGVELQQDVADVEEDRLDARDGGLHAASGSFRPWARAQAAKSSGGGAVSSSGRPEAGWRRRSFHAWSIWRRAPSPATSSGVRERSTAFM